MKKSFFNFVLAVLCFLFSFQFAGAQNNSDTSLQEGLNSTLQLLGIVDSSKTPPAGNAACTDFYNLGSAEITLAPALPRTVAGATITFSGMVKNTNPYPLVGLDIYVKVFRKQEGSDAKQNGHNLVGRFLAIKNLAIPAGASQAISVEWVVPTDAPTGEYALATYAIVGQRYNISGLYFTDTLTASLSDFTILGEQRGIVAFDKNGVKMNKKPFQFASPPLVFGRDEAVTIEVPITNSTKKARSGVIKWKQYNWDGLQKESIFDMTTDIFQLAPGETKIVSHRVTKQRGVMTYVSADIHSGQIYSMLDMRFARSGVAESRVDFASLSAFPLKGGKRASLQACLHGIGQETLKDGRLDLVLTDKQGEVIASEKYAGNITSSMMGITKKFTPSKNYDQVKLAVTLTRAGVVEASSTISYDCTTIDPAQCLGESPAGTGENNFDGKSGLLPLLLIVLLATGLGGLYFYKHKQKDGGNAGVPLATLFAVLFSAALLGMNPAPASAHTVPSIDGPSTGATGATLTFNLTTTNAHAFYYEIDWNDDGVPDQCAPGACTNIAAGSSQSASFTWGTPGPKTIRARTVDSIGTSAWVTHDVGITDPSNFTISLTNIICPNESELPNISNANEPQGPPIGITATYAADWLAANPWCKPAADWQFQWAYSPARFQGGDFNNNQGYYEGTFIGEADGTISPIGTLPRANTGNTDDDWHTSGMSNANGVAVASVPIKTFFAFDSFFGDMYWVRGLMRSGYGIHSDDMNPASLGNVGAELHCSDNNAYYDNLEGFKLNGAVNIYCVSFQYAVTPDLTISVEPSLNTGTLLAGSTVTFKGTVLNGGSNFSTNFNNRFEIDIGNDGTVDTTLTPHPTLPGLGSLVPAVVTSGSWTNIPVGTHRVILCADNPAPVISESNETNNCSPAGTGLFAVSPAPPTVITNAATAVTVTTATLNGRGNPNGALATGWFRYSPVSPPVGCNDAFGTRSPATGGTLLGSGTAGVNFTSAISGLTGGTTYFYCAIASNSAGTAFGTVESFVSDALPDLMISLNPTLNTGTLFAGNTITFRGTIMNGGSIAVVGTYNNRFEIDLGNDGTVDVTLAPHPTLSNTAAGTGAQVISGSWSNIPIGTHRVILCADNPAPAITESNETNNCSANTGATGVFTVAPAPLPDLTISAPPTLNTGTLFAGNTVTFRGTIMNGGSTAVVGTYNNRFEIDLGNNGTVDVTLAPHPTLANTAPSISAPVTSGSWTNIPVGTHRVILCADNPTPVITESNETNNCSPAGTGLFTVVQPPALSISPMSQDFGSAVVNTSKDLPFTITNIGGGTLTGTMVFPAGPFTCSTANVGGCTFTNLTPGPGVVFYITFTPPTVGPIPVNLIDVTSNVPTKQIQVWGSGIPAVSGNSLDFGRVIVNKNKELVLTITNNGATPMSGTLNLPAPYTCIGSSAGMTGSVCNYNIVGGGTNTMTIRFVPPAVGTFPRNISLSGNPATFGLNGVGYTPTFDFQEL